MPKYKRNSIRLRQWDYSSQGWYFVTVCSQKMASLFGMVENGKMKLNHAGKIINDLWNELPEKYKNIEIDEFIVMPNHMHGIIKIKNYPTIGRENRAHTLGQMIAYFKYQTTKYINELYRRGEVLSPEGGILPPDVIIKIWQRNYYERIIRNEVELNKIREYIINNPLKWDLDKNNPRNIKIKW